MNTKLYTDGELTALRSMPKRITNPRARWAEKPSGRPAHRQRNFQASGQQDGEVRFSVYQRQNLNDDSDFSCGIGISSAASERAITAGKKPELAGLDAQHDQPRLL